MRRLMLLFWRVSRTDLRFLWFALRHPARPGWLLPIAIGLGLYALSPLNFAVPLVGVMDDLVIVPLALHWLLTLLPPALRMEFENPSPRSGRPPRGIGRPV
jgi:uncharacterized membrane protein YkvA (DUF1232 family)